MARETVGAAPLKITVADGIADSDVVVFTYRTWEEEFPFPPIAWLDLPVADVLCKLFDGQTSEGVARAHRYSVASQLAWSICRSLDMRLLRESKLDGGRARL